MLKYRLPNGQLPPGGVPWPLQDVRRAVQIVRAHAGEWHIDPRHVGVMGFSAGGSVASLAGVHWLPGNPHAKAPLDRFSTRPDFLVPEREAVLSRAETQRRICQVDQIQTRQAWVWAGYSRDRLHTLAIGLPPMAQAARLSGRRLGAALKPRCIPGPAMVQTWMVFKRMLSPRYRFWIRMEVGFEASHRATHRMTPWPHSISLDTGTRDSCRPAD